MIAGASFASAVAGGPIRRIALLASVFPATIGLAVTVERNGDQGHAAAIAFGTCAFLLSWWSLGGVATLRGDLTELRVPRISRPLAGISVAITLAVAGAPSLLVYAALGHIADIAIIGVGTAAGVACAFLEPWLTERIREARLGRARLIEPERAVIGHWPKRRSPVLAYRMALGPPYSPTSWRGRAEQLAILIGIAGIGAVFGSVFVPWHLPGGLTRVLHASWGFSLWSAAVLCWVWPMTRPLKVLGLRSGTCSELALLPVRGDRAAKGSALFYAIVAGPLTCVAAVAALAVLGGFLDHAPASFYPRVLLGAVLLTGTTLLPVVRAVEGSVTTSGSAAVFSMLMPVVAFTPALFLTNYNSGLSLARWVLLLLGAAGLSSWAAIAFAVGRVAGKPHVFAEVSRTARQLPLELRNPQ
jgi:hypothetical protein